MKTEQLTVNPAQWNAQAAYWVGQTQQHATTEEIRAQVEQGGASMFEIRNQAGEVCGAFVLRIEQRNTGPEGVILSAAAKLPGVDMVGAMLEHIESRFVDCNSIRMHTAIPALARRVAAFGYGVTELVCTKEKQHAKH